MTTPEELDALQERDAAEKKRRKAISSHDAQMADAMAQCVPCKLCGGKAIIADAGPGHGYYIECEKAARYTRQSCLQSGVRISGWAYNVSDLWNRLNAPADDVTALRARVAELEAERAAAQEETAMAFEVAADRDRIEKMLRQYRMQYTWGEDGLGYPLVDACSPGPTIEEGELEIHLIADAVCAVILDSSPAHVTAALAARDKAVREQALRDAELARLRQGVQVKPLTEATIERLRHDLQFIVDTIVKDKVKVRETYPRLFAVLQQRRAEIGNLGAVQVFGEIARDLLQLMDGDHRAALVSPGDGCGSRQSDEWHKGYAQGYVTACGLVVAMHGEAFIAAEVLSQETITWPEIEAMNLDEYDMESLRKIFQEPCLRDNKQPAPPASEAVRDDYVCECGERAEVGMVGGVPSCYVCGGVAPPASEGGADHG